MDSNFTLASVCKIFGLTLQRKQLFIVTQSKPLPQWLTNFLKRAMPFALVSEKARSEFIVAPILLTLSEQYEQEISIYSGQRLDVDVSNGLVGECDFIITCTPPLPILQSPIMVVVEAKKNDIEAGLGQCASQMVGARLFNQQEQNTITKVFGCVTTGEDWQFLKLEDETLVVDSQRYYIDNVGSILTVFDSLFAECCNMKIPHAVKN